jgi:hypothetical protein
MLPSRKMGGAKGLEPKKSSAHDGSVDCEKNSHTFKPEAESLLWLTLKKIQQNIFVLAWDISLSRSKNTRISERSFMTCDTGESY